MKKSVGEFIWIILNNTFKIGNMKKRDQTNASTKVCFQFSTKTRLQWNARLTTTRIARPAASTASKATWTNRCWRSIAYHQPMFVLRCPGICWLTRSWKVWRSSGRIWSKHGSIKIAISILFGELPKHRVFLRALFKTTLRVVKVANGHLSCFKQPKISTPETTIRKLYITTYLLIWLKNQWDKSSQFSAADSPPSIISNEES